MAKTLRDEIETVVFRTLTEQMIDVGSPRKIAPHVAGAVWELLEDRVGSVQEKLMNDLMIARSERDAMQRERDSLGALVLELRPKTDE